MQFPDKDDPYFQQLERDKEATQAASQYITNTLNHALKNQDFTLLLSLIPYINSGPGTLPYSYIGETHRIFRILCIIELERQNQKTPFSAGCTDKESLWEKYMLSLFAMRRLLFQLSDSSVTDAAFYLRKSTLSVFAVYIISQDDLIIPDSFFYEKIIDIYSEFWDQSDLQLLYAMINANEDTQ